MLFVVLEFDEGIACVVHTDESRAISLLRDNYGHLPNLVAKLSIKIADAGVTPSIYNIRGVIPVSQSRLQEAKSKAVQSDVYQFGSKQMPEIQVHDEDFSNAEDNKAFEIP